MIKTPHIQHYGTLYSRNLINLNSDSSFYLITRSIFSIPWYIFVYNYTIQLEIPDNSRLFPKPLEV